MARQGRFFHHVSERRCFQVFEFRFGSLPSASIPIERPGCIVPLKIASSVTSLRRQVPDIELVFLFRGLLAVLVPVRAWVGIPFLTEGCCY